MGTFLQTDSAATAGGIRAALMRRRRESAYFEHPASSRAAFQFSQLSASEFSLAGGKSPATTVSRLGTNNAKGGCHLADRTFGA